MHSPRPSLKTTIVILLSLLSMGLVILAWEVYRDFTFEIHSSAVKELVNREAHAVIDELNEIAGGVAEDTLSDAEFNQALADGNATRLSGLMGAKFDQYQGTAGGLKLIQSYVYDADLNVIAWARNGLTPKDDKTTVCLDVLKQTKALSEVAKVEKISGLCPWRDYAYFTLMVPLKEARGEGYLQLVVDPYTALSKIEQILALPMLIQSTNNEINYRSPSWFPAPLGSEVIMVDYWLSDLFGKPIVQLLVQKDMRNIVLLAQEARNRLAIFAGVLTLIIALIALWALQKSTFSPLRKLLAQLNLVREDRDFLRTPVKVSGNAEVRELVQVFNEMSLELASAYEECEEAAFTDQLTSLPNRALFLDRLKQMILLSQRNGEKLGIMLLDLDGFKEVNDTLGHQVGDQVLQQIAARLKLGIRASSTIARVIGEDAKDGRDSKKIKISGTTLARLGGDEFAILLPNLIDVDGATSVARRVTELLEPHTEVEGNAIVVAGTLGIAMYPEHGEDAEALLRRADIALYVAKHIHNDFSVYDPVYDTHSVKQLALKAELRTAIEGDQMVLHYQPKLNYKTGCITSVEALVRWQHAERGMIPPDLFIPISEQRGLIGPLTEWVIKKALWQLNQWQRKDIFLQVAVNLSSRVLYDLSLPNKIERMLIRANVPPSSLILEITEDATMVDPKRALDIMNRLNDMGLSLSIDDFGTGYSSLGYLKRLPVEEIKIDRSFVMDMEESDNDAKIVRATIDLAHNLGLQVVAEGVETENCLNILKALKCDYAQGYYLSRPIPPDELLTWLAESGWGCKA